MNIYSEAGTKVRFTGIGGYDRENAYARSMLLVGQILTVSRTEVHSWHTDVYFKEVEGGFNSVMFEEVEDESV